jgi:hypothetical protein
MDGKFGMVEAVTFAVLAITASVITAIASLNDTIYGSNSLITSASICMKETPVSLRRE